MRQILILLLIFGLPSCREDEPKVPDCDKVQACTEIFSYINVIVTKNGGPIQLDDVQSINQENGSVYTFDENHQNESGHYVLISDGQMQEIMQTGSRIQFKASLDGKQVINESYIIGHDCCHITFVDGKEKIEL
jgi:hypothetical protein